MSNYNRVIWSEGLFLLPQHFQQTERYLEHQLVRKLQQLSIYPWGISALEWDQASLEAGQLTISRIEGIFPDGTPFKAPAFEQCPAPVMPERKDSIQRVFIASPAPTGHKFQIEREATSNEGARYVAVQSELPNLQDPDTPTDIIETACLKLRIVVAENLPDGLQGIELTRLMPIHLNNDTSIHLKSEYWPALLCVSASMELVQRIEQLLQTLHARSNTLQGRRLNKGNYDSTELGQFLMLQAVSRHRLILSHLIKHSPLHPYRLWEALLACLGDIQPFSPKSLTGFDEHYNHTNPRPSLIALIERIFESLNLSVGQKAVQIPLSKKGLGVFLAQINDLQLARQALFVLAVKGGYRNPELNSRLPRAIKIGPAEKLRDLVNLNLPGIALSPQERPLACLPYLTDQAYFELSSSPENLWSPIHSNGQLAFHYSGSIAELEFELWAISTDTLG